MHLLSCWNCCHNPLQLGAVGLPFGYCTRHDQVLRSPTATTCGQLLRKDLLSPRVIEQREIHAHDYPSGRVALLAAPRDAARASETTERPNGQLAADPVAEEAVDYRLQQRKIATMAGLRRLPGGRAEAAMLCLARGYVHNCLANRGRWTSGLHLLHWTLLRLTEEPAFALTDLWGPVALPVERLVELERWRLVMMRLAQIADVANAARQQQEERVGELADLPEKAAQSTQPGSLSSLLGWLRKHQSVWEEALPTERYRQLAASLHCDE
jgi:hypothetical protein